MNILENEFAAYGKTLVKIQYFEIILKICISLFDAEAKARHSSIKNLKIEDVLNLSVSYKQTLGTLMAAIRKEIPVFDTDEFSKLLVMRNTFVHNFHKEYISRGVDEKERMAFIEELFELITRYTEIFTGLFVHLARHIAKEKNGTLNLAGLEVSEDELLKHIVKSISP
ncbi:hypothetical protein [Halopseudomonas maritima]|uniref:hypothetical protein n=1 Tax=Halopseudomonas maritima TaxID=2918528 RepID=UPI001EEBEFCB|nr:hypothetical protein [Halopseudomonas maritima]UJJ31949.1 hypothetical protein HV822_01880 [Halopseudomonas maritima]